MSSSKQHRDFVALDADILQTHLSVLAEAMDKEKFELVVRALAGAIGPGGAAIMHELTGISTDVIFLRE